MSEPGKCVAVLAGACVGAALSVGTCRAAPASAQAPIDFSRIASPIIHKGNATCAYRDPAAHYHDGVFRVFHTLHRRDDDGHYYVYLAVTRSRDLVRWTKPRVLTPKDRKLNFSSPGNVVRHGGKWAICLQTYPTPNDETFGTQDARVWTMTSDDLERWSQPELLRVKGPDVAVKDMGRMIDPYLLRDRDKPSRWWCFYKQRGVSMSYSDDGMKTWTYHGRTNCGENVCVLAEEGRYVIFHSPGNGIGVKASRDLKRFEDVALLTLGQKDWPWAQGRLTAGQVLDLRREPRVGKALLFFHGSSKAGLAQHRAHGHGTLALAWSDDLKTWHWPGKPRVREAAVSGDLAKAILDAAGVKGGLVVHLGCGGGRLTAALRANERFLVHGLEADAAKVAAARAHVRAAGLSGSVWVDRFDGKRLPYAENMVNLLVAEELGEVSMDEVRRVLVPHGAAYVKTAGPLEKARGKRWVKSVKPWPGDIDEWTHWLHGADGNAVARDGLAGPPRRLRWLAGPLWSRSHDSVPSVSAIVSAAGRLFYIVDEAPASMDGSAPDKWALVARDAFNGLKLWRVPIGEWGWQAWGRRFTCRFTVPTHMPRRLVAAGDRVYVTLGFNAPLTELDAATGKALRTFQGTQFTDEVLCDGRLLIVSINKAAQGPGPRKGASPPPVRKWVAAIDRRSGRMLWKTGDYVGLRSKTGPMERISHLSMVAGGGQVFFVDGDEIVSLSLADGREKWRVARPGVPENKMRYNIRITDMCTLVYGGGMLFFAQLNPDRGIDWREIRGKLHAFSAETGEEVWSHQCSSWGWGHPADVFIVRDLVWVTGFKDDLIHGLDLKTGEVRRKVSDHKAFDNAHHHRCYRNKATVRYLMTSFRGLEFIDWGSGRTDRHHWVRGTCRLGAIPCNGMIYATPHPCDCYITSKLNGFLALQPAAPPAQAADERPALEKGPAYGANPPFDKLRAGNPQSNGWPTYRHDAQRSGATTTTVELPLKTLWQADLGEALTSPVVAAGRVFVARGPSREVVCLDAADGREQWRYTAGGRLDTPPTIHGGRVVFGCTDGWVYCLRAADGALMWRFRAAPRERLVGAFGGLESAWPVHGSVLAAGETVYCSAGRSSFLDGGIHAYALKLDTGEVLAREQLSSAHDMDVDWGRDQTVDTGVLSDLLVAHEGGIYLRQRPLFGRGEGARIARHLRATGGLLDSNWFHRTRWFVGGAPLAEYLVFDGKRVFGVRARQEIGGYGGHFAPGKEGFELFSAALASIVVPKVGPAPAGKPKTYRGSRGRPSGGSSTPRVRRPKDLWCIHVPVRVTAMVLAGDVLIAAGTPDTICPEDPWAAYEGRKGGRLLVISTADGTIAAERELAAPPVLDGLAAARGRLFLSAADGKVTCLGAK